MSLIEKQLADQVADAVVLKLQSKLMNMEQKLEALVYQVQQSNGRGVQQTNGRRSIGGPAPSVRRSSIGIPVSKSANAASGMSARTISKALANPADGLVQDLLQPSADKRGFEMIRNDSESDYDSDEEEGDSRARIETNGNAGGPVDWILDKVKTCSTIQEEPRKGVFADFVDSSGFANCSFVVIVVNTMFVWFVTDYIAANLTVETGWMNNLEMAFLSYYLVEVVMKLMVHRLYFFCNADWAWNVFDLIIVCLGAGQALLEEFTDSRSLDITFLRACRIMRVSKILRLFKAVRFFSELKLMASCLVGSLGSLFWATLFFWLMLMMAALVFVQSTANFRIENSQCDDEELCDQIPVFFGSVLSAMIVLFQSTTGGCDWGDVYNVVALTGTSNAAFFICFIIFFTFAFFNVVMSMFVDKAMKLAQPDENEQLVEKREEYQNISKELRDLIKDMDEDGSGTISIAELEKAGENDRIKFKFEMLGLSVREAKLFFETLTFPHRRELDIDDFVEACMKMKGPASGIDLQAIDFAVRDIARRMDTHMESASFQGDDQGDERDFSPIKTGFVK